VPYIEPHMREFSVFKRLREVPKLPAGELNYAITQLLLSQKPECYDDYNTLIGVLESVKLEFYRKAIVPYEEEKCRMNGEVFVTEWSKK
jgi:hypothetical protein